MTLGQRIAQKRKEQGLSQEALGSALGVSRQAIYKWESDATFPEIEKLIAMSRLFSVPVGWLLGVEEESAPAAAGAELSEAQLAMVQEIVDRYLSALPGPAPGLSPGRRRLVKVCVALGALCMAAALWSLSRQLSRLDQRYMDLQNTVGGIQSNVSAQIGGISSRVEEILKAQNDLTADYGTEIKSTDPAGNMVTFSFRAVPRTFQEGMTAWFEVDNGVSRFTFGPYSPSGQTFAGEAEMALTDSMSLYIVFEHDGVRETQLLDQYSGLWSDSMPQFLMTSIVRILKMDRNRCLCPFYTVHSCKNGIYCCIALRGTCHISSSLGKNDLGFRHTHPLYSLCRGGSHHQRLRICISNVLRSKDHNTSGNEFHIFPCI